MARINEVIRRQGEAYQPIPLTEAEPEPPGVKPIRAEIPKGWSIRRRGRSSIAYGSIIAGLDCEVIDYGITVIWRVECALHDLAISARGDQAGEGSGPLELGWAMAAYAAEKLRLSGMVPRPNSI